MKFVKFYRTHFYRRQLGDCFRFLATVRTYRLNIVKADWLSKNSKKSRPKELTVLVSKVFKITKVEGNIFCGWGRRSEQKWILSRSSHSDLFQLRSEIFGKTHRKISVLCKSLSSACRCQTLLKRDSCIAFFLWNSSE